MLRWIHDQLRSRKRQLSFAGSGFTASGGVNIAGRGGVIFYTTTNSDPSGAGYSTIAISGGSSTNLVAPKSSMARNIADSSL
jgi:hypothetical protein